MENDAETWLLIWWIFVQLNPLNGEWKKKKKSSNKLNWFVTSLWRQFILANKDELCWKINLILFVAVGLVARTTKKYALINAFIEEMAITSVNDEIPSIFLSWLYVPRTKGRYICLLCVSVRAFRVICNAGLCFWTPFNSEFFFKLC